MSTQTIVLTQTPTLITDGTKAAYIQEIRGKYTRFASSPTQPDTEAYAQILDDCLYVCIVTGKQIGRAHV